MNITNLYTNTDSINQLRSNGYGAAEFDIDVAPLVYTPSDLGPEQIKSSKKVVFRTDTYDELGVHGEKYKAVPPKEMIENTRKILERSQLNLRGVTEDIQTSHKGSRTFVKYNLPEHSFMTPDGDTATLSLLAITSFDSSWPFMISVAAEQSACLNLQVFVSGEVAVFKSKHTKGLDINHGSNIIMKSLDVFENERDLWAEWYKKPYDILEAMKLFCEVGNCKPALDFYKENPLASPFKLMESVRINDAVEYMWNRHLTSYTKRFGHTFWAAYNSITDWSTHAGVSNRSSISNLPSIQNQRQEKVRTILRAA